MYLNGAIDWSAKAIKLVPDSSCEAEMAQASRACKAGIAVRMLLRAARRKVIGPTPMLGDNKAYTEIVQQEGASARTRYYERAVLLVKRAVLLLIMSVYLIGTDSMSADGCRTGARIHFEYVVFKRYRLWRGTVSPDACKPIQILQANDVT